MKISGLMILQEYLNSLIGKKIKLYTCNGNTYTYTFNSIKGEVFNGKTYTESVNEIVGIDIVNFDIVYPFKLIFKDKIWLGNNQEYNKLAIRVWEEFEIID